MEKVKILARQRAKNGRGETLTVECISCKKSFLTNLSSIKRGKGRCCSLKCRIGIYRGSHNTRWNGGKTHRREYILVSKPMHPFTDARGYVSQHRLVVENKKKITLHPWIEIHHKNGIKNDNRFCNLEILSKSDHRRKEQGWIKSGEDWQKICSGCNEQKIVSTENFYQSYNKAYSYYCIDCSKRKTMEYRRAKTTK